jgi:hypothetical protein
MSPLIPGVLIRSASNVIGKEKIRETEGKKRKYCRG